MVLPVSQSNRFQKFDACKKNRFKSVHFCSFVDRVLRKEYVCQKGIIIFDETSRGARKLRRPASWFSKNHSPLPLSAGNCVRTIEANGIHRCNFFALLSQQRKEPNISRDNKSDLIQPSCLSLHSWHSFRAIELRFRLWNWSRDSRKIPKSHAKFHRSRQWHAYPAIFLE